MSLVGLGVNRTVAVTGHACTEGVNMRQLSERIMNRGPHPILRMGKPRLQGFASFKPHTPELGSGPAPANTHLHSSPCWQKIQRGKGTVREGGWICSLPKLYFLSLGQ